MGIIPHLRHFFLIIFIIFHIFLFFFLEDHFYPWPTTVYSYSRNIRGRFGEASEVKITVHAPLYLCASTQSPSLTSKYRLTG